MNFQESVAWLVWVYFRGILYDIKAAKIAGRERLTVQGYLDNYLGDITEKARCILKTQDEKLKASEHTRYITNKEELQVKPGNPLTLICFDDARGLPFPGSKLDTLETRLAAFRDALECQHRVFGLLLDSSLSITENPPGKLFARELFPPIYKIDTMDVFARGQNSRSCLLKILPTNLESRSTRRRFSPLADLCGELCFRKSALAYAGPLVSWKKSSGAQRRMYPNCSLCYPTGWTSPCLPKVLQRNSPEITSATSKDQQAWSSHTHNATIRADIGTGVRAQDGSMRRPAASRSAQSFTPEHQRRQYRPWRY